MTRSATSRTAHRPRECRRARGDRRSRLVATDMKAPGWRRWRSVPAKVESGRRRVNCGAVGPSPLDWPHGPAGPGAPAADSLTDGPRMAAHRTASLSTTDARADRADRRIAAVRGDAHPAAGRDDHGVARNPGMPLDLDLVRRTRVNRSAVERRAATIPTRRTVKKEWQAAWLLRAITCMDLTTLSGDDTAGQRAAAVREGPNARAARRAARTRCAGAGRDGGRGVCLSRTGAGGRRGAGRLGHSGGGGVDGLSGRPDSAAAAHRGDPRVGGGRARARSTS